MLTAVTTDVIAAVQNTLTQNNSINYFFQD